MNFNINGFFEVLPKMGLGMLGIFIVTAVIIAFIWLLNFATNPEKNVFNKKK